MLYLGMARFGINFVMPKFVVFIMYLLNSNCECCLTDYLPCGYGVCVYVSNWCDGQIDCGNGQDEVHCGEHARQCPYNWLPCGNGQCFYKEYRCNFYADCINGFDEQNCPKENAFQCPYNWLSCGNDQCFHTNWKCNGFSDCINGFDEKNCHEGKTDDSPTKSIIPSKTTTSLINTKTTRLVSTLSLKKEQNLNGMLQTKETTLMTKSTSIAVTNLTSTNTIKKSTTKTRTSTVKTSETPKKKTVVSFTTQKVIFSPSTVMDIQTNDKKDLSYVVPVSIGLVLIFLVISILSLCYTRRLLRRFQTKISTRSKADLGNDLEMNQSVDRSEDSCAGDIHPNNIYDEIDESLSEKSIDSYSIYENNRHGESGSSSENSLKILPEAPPLPVFHKNNALTQENEDMDIACQEKIPCVKTDSGGYAIAQRAPIF